MAHAEALLKGEEMKPLEGIDEEQKDSILPHSKVLRTTTIDIVESHKKVSNSLIVYGVKLGVLDPPKTKIVKNLLESIGKKND